jgi:hypothetical protein
MYTEACAERERGGGLEMWKIPRFEKGETDIEESGAKTRERNGEVKHQNLQRK